MLQTGQTSSGAMGAFEDVVLFGNGRTLDMVCAPFLIGRFALFGVFGLAISRDLEG
jgi:hypothetical protein